uniref:Ypsilon schachtel (inferred by orthology to a D. melanogaster protein) n=1 Tax=Strongyloides venezuelensis TaxID=75913 RepID=A0A0K0FCY1_STRVS
MGCDNSTMNVEEALANYPNDINNPSDKELETRDSIEVLHPNENISNKQNKEAKDNGNTISSSNKEEKKVLETGVTGTVKWYNVKLGYGFIRRHDTSDCVFVYHQSIAKKNPNKRLRSLGTDEEVVFDVVEGMKGLEAGNVTGPNGEPVKGSHIDKRYKRKYRNGRRFQRFYRKFNMENKERDPNQKYVEEKVQGKVLFFNSFKGYGFIKRNDKDENVFCHVVDVVKKNPKKFYYLPTGTPVLFDIVEGLKGPEAAFVTDGEGKPLPGVKKRNPRLNKSPSSSKNSSENDGEVKNVSGEGRRNRRPPSRRNNRRNNKNINGKEDGNNEPESSSDKENMVSNVINDDGSSFSNNNLVVDSKTIQLPSNDVSLMAEALGNLNIV